MHMAPCLTWMTDVSCRRALTGHPNVWKENAVLHWYETKLSFLVSAVNRINKPQTLLKCILTELWRCCSQWLLHCLCRSCLPTLSHMLNEWSSLTSEMKSSCLKGRPFLAYELVGLCLLYPQGVFYWACGVCGCDGECWGCCWGKESKTRTGGYPYREALMPEKEGGFHILFIFHPWYLLNVPFSTCLLLYQDYFKKNVIAGEIFSLGSVIMTALPMQGLSSLIPLVGELRSPCCSGKKRKLTYTAHEVTRRKKPRRMYV